jgi:hypothetical protein
MSLSKFSLILVLSFYSMNAFSTFTEKECLDSTYKTEVSHKDKRTFGMAKTKLSVSKDKCEITVSHEKLKFFKNRWIIDVCREPIHIKSGVKGVEVLKKQGNCPNKDSADFCDAYKTIREVLQDDGLIFAPGEKENISTDHGKIYCTYQLLGDYLESGRIFSRYAPAKKIAPAYSSPITTTPKVIVTPAPAVDPSPPEDKQPSQGQSGSF